MPINLTGISKHLKGIEYGRISLWSGITNHGKTTLMTQFAKELLKSGKKIFYFSGEQSAIEFKNSLYVGMCKKEDLEFITDSHNSKIYDVKPKKEISERIAFQANKEPVPKIINIISLKSYL